MVDDTKLLVLFVPADSMVRITSAPLVVPDDEAQGYEKVDLRRDIMLWCHDCAGHPGLGPTVELVKKIAYWNGMLTVGGKGSVPEHVKLCAHCSARATAEEEHGLGIDSKLR